MFDLFGILSTVYVCLLFFSSFLSVCGCCRCVQNGVFVKDDYDEYYTIFSGIAKGYKNSTEDFRNHVYEFSVGKIWKEGNCSLGGSLGSSSESNLDSNLDSNLETLDKGDDSFMNFMNLRSLNVSTCYNTVCCGIDFILGEEYLVYAYGNKNRRIYNNSSDYGNDTIKLTSDSCSRTKQIKNAKSDIDQLNDIVTKECSSNSINLYMYISSYYVIIIGIIIIF